MRTVNRHICGRFLGRASSGCIPWFFDDKGQRQGLEELIKNGCDSVAVMNYYRGSEIKHIAVEAELAQAYGKGLINIYELLKAGRHGLKEVTTYHNQGLARCGRISARCGRPIRTSPSPSPSMTTKR